METSSAVAHSSGADSTRSGSTGTSFSADRRASGVTEMSSANGGALIPSFRIVALAEGGTMSQLQTLCLAPAVATVLARRFQSAGVTETSRDSGSSVSSVKSAADLPGNSVKVQDRGLVTVVWRKGRTTLVGGESGGSSSSSSSSSGSASDLIPHAPFDALFAGPPDRERMRRVMLAGSEPVAAGTAVGSAAGEAGAAGAGAGGSGEEAALVLRLMDSWPDVMVQADMPADPPLASLRWLNVSLPLCATSAASASASSASSGGSESGRSTAEGVLTETDTVVTLLLPNTSWSLASSSLSNEEVCTARRLEAACLGGVRPSAGVAAIMRAHPASALSRLLRTTAVYLEANEELPPGSCPGCPEDPLLNCTLRTLAWQYLGEVAPEREAGAAATAGGAGVGTAATAGTAGGAAGGEGRGGEGGGRGGGGGGQEGHTAEGRRVDFTMGAFWAADAAAVARTFHPLRAPLLLDVTLARLKACPSPTGGAGEIGGKERGRGKDGEEDGDGGGEGEGEEGGRGGGEGKGEMGRAGDGEGEEGEEGEGEVVKRSKKQQGRRRLLSEEKREKRSGEGSKDKGGEGMASGLSGKSSSKKADSAGNSSSSVEFNTTLCAQLQVAEAWVVSAAAALIHTRASLEARFLRAQAAAGTARGILGLEGGRRLGERGSRGAGGADGRVEGEGAEGAEAAMGGEDAAGAAEKGSFSVRRVPFSVAPTVCEAPKAESFGKQRFLRQFIVDEDLKAIYCFVPKVACTGWKTWFREQQGQANVSDVFLTHDKARSGLRILAYHFPEHRAIELLTRPDFFKFSFVRNPYTRLASVYLNKHVGGGPPYSRQFWNKMFFRKFVPFRRLVNAKQGNDSFSFGEFAWLLRLMREQRRARMESHVQPQIDACRFDKIRFDFVGRFENLAEDVGVVLQRLNRTVGDSGAFNISKDAHPTNAGSKLLELYDEQSYEEGSLLYSMDMDIPLNGIHFEPPPELMHKFGKLKVAFVSGGA
ncbi:unnamed protein product [Closterium sp. Naga37s-1]|nr:unnamed protein product [Closterium sp. Naga37s-1]